MLAIPKTVVPQRDAAQNRIPRNEKADFLDKKLALIMKKSSHPKPLYNIKNRIEISI